MNRPIGVNLLIAWYVLGAMVGVFGGLVMITNLFGPSALPDRIRLVGGTAMVILGFVEAFVAKGLWELRNWARLAVVVFSVVHFISIVRSLVLVAQVAQTTSSTILLGIATFLIALLAICIWVVWYLFRPRVKQVFEAA